MRNCSLWLSTLLVVFIGGCAFGAPPPYVKPVKPPKGLAPAPFLKADRKVKSFKRLSGADRLFDGKYRSDSWEGGHPTQEAPSWVALNVGAGAEKLLVVWTASANFPYDQTQYGGPGWYRVETSADTTDGENGTWTTAAEVKDNGFRARSHLVPFAGQKWLRLTVLGPTKETNQYGVRIDELDVHDVSAGAEETFFFLGDSITAFSFDRADKHRPSVSDLLGKKHPGHAPAMLNAGIGFEKASDGLKRLPLLLEQNPGFNVWCLGYGTNDAAGNNVNTADFEQSLSAMVDLLKKAGKTPVIAHIPFAPKEHDGVSAFNDVIDRVAKANGLIAGPDLYAHFKAHPEELADGLHPNDAGMVSINRLWAEALEALY